MCTCYPVVSSEEACLDFFQNKILHGQLESLHIRLAGKERISAGIASENADSKAENDLHSVISYLRRSKEIVSGLCLYLVAIEVLYIIR